jgi:hypothetical protein
VAKVEYFHKTGTKEIRFVVIAARELGKWLLVRHKVRLAL